MPLFATGTIVLLVSTTFPAAELTLIISTRSIILSSGIGSLTHDIEASGQDKVDKNDSVRYVWTAMRLSVTRPRLGWF